MSLPTPIYPGINLDANAGPQMNAVAIASIILSCITIILRLISRLNTHVPIDMDDWLIVVAAVRFYNSKPNLFTEVWQSCPRSFPGVSLPQWLSRSSSTIMASTSVNLIRTISKSSTKGCMPWRLSILLLWPSVNCHFSHYIGASFESQVQDVPCKSSQHSI